MAIEERIGFNPYQFGLIGSTDAHSGLSTAEEPNFWWKSARDSIPESKAGLFRGADADSPNGWSISASGLAAVWAEENTREAILAAFKRREVYATTGPRIVVRVAVMPDIHLAGPVCVATVFAKRATTPRAGVAQMGRTAGTEDQGLDPIDVTPGATWPTRKF